MDRLTCRLRKDCITIKGAATFYNPKSKGALAQAIVKLACYEDTGMTPAEIITLKAERGAAVRDIQLIADRGVMCVACGNRNQEQEDPTIGCPKDDTCTYNGDKWSPNFVWRGPQKEEKRV